jgi:hypothetical protein
MLRDRDWPFIRVDSQGHGTVTAERGDGSRYRWLMSVRILRG